MNINTDTPRRSPAEQYKLDVHFEISVYMLASMDSANTMSGEIYKLIGRSGLYKMAAKLTDLFMERHPFKTRLDADDFACKIIAFLANAEMYPSQTKLDIIEKRLRFNFQWAYADPGKIKDYGSVQVGDHHWANGSLIPFRYLQDGQESQFQVFAFGQWHNAHRTDFYLLHDS